MLRCAMVTSKTTSPAGSFTNIHMPKRAWSMRLCTIRAATARPCTASCTANHPPIASDSVRRGRWKQFFWYGRRTRISLMSARRAESSSSALRR